MIRLPVRIDLAGSWSDQTDWPEAAAVINAAVGWDGEYPLQLNAAGKLTRSVSGIGTGLGISSILAGGRFLQQRPDGDYIGAVLEWEQRNGTKGGWQDQIGGIVPGFKRITTSDHRTFHLERRDDHPILKILVLVDTGRRRHSKLIGDRVRFLMQSRHAGFCGALRRNIADTEWMLRSDCVQDFAEASLAAFSRLSEWVPGMSVVLPPSPDAWGSRLVGAGGGGFGLYFARSLEQQRVLLEFLRSRGLWARVPELLPGAQFS